MGPGVEPGVAPAHPLDIQPPLVQVGFQQGGDLQLAPRRRLHRPRPRGRVGVKEVKPGHGIVRRRDLGLLDDLDRPAIAVEGDHAVAFRVCDVIAENRRLGPRVRLLQHLGQAVAEEDVVAQDHRRRRAGQEILGQDVGLRQPVGTRLHDPFEPQPPLAAVAQQALELGLVVGGGDDRDLADAGQHQDADRIIDHRLVVDRQQLFRHAHGDRIKPRARAAGQDDALPLGGTSLGHAESSSITGFRLSRQSGRGMSKSRVMAAQCRREFSGLRAGVG